MLDTKEANYSYLFLMNVSFVKEIPSVVKVTAPS